VLLTVSVSNKGGFRLATKAGMYIRIDPDEDDCLKADAVDYLSAYTIFYIGLQNAVRPQISSFAWRTECLLAEIKYLWNAVVGFFLAIGLGPFLISGEFKPGFFELVRSSEPAMNALKAMTDKIVSSPKATATIIFSGLACIGVLYEKGVLWKVFKFVLKGGAWMLISKAITKVIEVVFLPEAEAAEMLVGLAMWAHGVYTSALEVDRVCYGNFLSI
jgi:hypothetical protein